MMTFQQLQSLPISLLLALSFLLGLIIGSFLNVVVHRLPHMLYRQWRHECHEFLGHTETPESGTYNLATPGSHCPQCQTPIRWYHNIPVLSYAWLGGRCTHCGQRISWKYPVIELTTALLSTVTIYHFGPTLAGGLALLFTWALIALAAIDLQEQILPDSLTLGLVWLGLLASLGPVFVSSHDAILGAVIAYSALWLVYQIFKLITGKEGMGYGDFKLYAAAGAWMGWQYLPMIILLASLLGAVVGITLISSGRIRRENPIPFGPYLALVNWICLLWGDVMLQAYLNWAGF